MSKVEKKNREKNFCHYFVRPTRFGSSGPSNFVSDTHRNTLTAKAFEDAEQGLSKRNQDPDSHTLFRTFLFSPH